MPESTRNSEEISGVLQEVVGGAGNIFKNKIINKKDPTEWVWCYLILFLVFGVADSRGNSRVQQCRAGRYL